MIKWDVVFDGSDNPGCVKFGDGVIEAVAYFKTDHDAKLFFGLMNEMRDEAQTARLKISDMKAKMREAIKIGGDADA